MSATDARTDLRMARDRLREAINIATIDSELSRRDDLEEALEHVETALRCVERALPEWQKDRPL